VDGRSDKGLGPLGLLEMVPKEEDGISESLIGDVIRNTDSDDNEELNSFN
jgi:hypothetical protein